MTGCKTPSAAISATSAGSGASHPSPRSGGKAASDTTVVVRGTWVAGKKCCMGVGGELMRLLPFVLGINIRDGEPRPGRGQVRPVD